MHEHSFACSTAHTVLGKHAAPGVDPPASDVTNRPAVRGDGMDDRARRIEADARDPVPATTEGVRFLHYCDGSWALVGDDGWPVGPNDLGVDTAAAIEDGGARVVDVEPLSVMDTEVP